MLYAKWCCSGTALKIQDLLTLPMPSIPKLVRRPQVLRLMAYGCPLTAKLKTGDVVEIVTNADSFGLAVTGLRWLRPPRARNKIRQFFKNQDKEASITKGRELSIAYFQEHGYVANKYLDKKHIEEIPSYECA